MGLGLFGPKRPKSPKNKVDTPVQAQNEQRKSDLTPIHDNEQFSKSHNANIAYPFHDVKATSFPSPLSIDASVFTEPQKQISLISGERKTANGRFSQDRGKGENGDQKETTKEEMEEETRQDKIRHSFMEDVCDLTTCTKERSKFNTCQDSRRNHRLEEKISPTKLTEMINSSIKEAMETIVKQCRMEDEKVSKEIEKKPNEDYEKTICYNKKEVPTKMKYEKKYEHRPRSMQDRSNNRSRSLKSYNNCCKSPRLPVQEKINTVCQRSKKLACEKDLKNHRKKENVYEDARSKKNSKSANNTKTDNRKMTGNVNIYICSEANENPQAPGKQKKSPPCTETSSETTTEQSNISSSKLMTCIKKKRRKLQEQDSLDLVPEKEETCYSTDVSNVCSCTTESTDSHTATKLESCDFVGIDNVCGDNIDVKNTESSLTDDECRCKDTSFSSIDVTPDKSDLSFQRSKYIVCDSMKVVKPCTSIYPSQTSSNSMDSENWTTKSVYDDTDRVCYYRDSYCVRNDHRKSCRERVPCDKDNEDAWLQKSVCTNRYRDRQSVESESDWQLKSVCKKDDSYTNNKNAGDSEENCRISCKNHVDKTCRCCCKETQELIVPCESTAQSNFKIKKRIRCVQRDNLTQQRSTCDRIAEEEEEEEESYTVCQNQNEEIKQKTVDCKKLSEHSMAFPKEYTVCNNYFNEPQTNSEAIDNEVSGNDTTVVTSANNNPKQNDNKHNEEIVKNNPNSTMQGKRNPDQGNRNTQNIGGNSDGNVSKTQEKSGNPTPPPMFLKFENRLLKNIAKSRPGSPPQTVNHKNVASASNKSEITEQPGKAVADGSKATERSKSTEREGTDSQDVAKGKIEDKDPRKKTIQEKLRVLSLWKTLKKILGSLRRRETPPEETSGKDKEHSTIDNKPIENNKLKLEDDKLSLKMGANIKGKDNPATPLRPAGLNIRKDGKDISTLGPPNRAVLENQNEKIDVNPKSPGVPTTGKILKDEEKRVSYDMTLERRGQPKLLTILAGRRASLSGTEKYINLQPTKEMKIPDTSKESTSQETKKDSIQEFMKRDPQESTIKPVPKEQSVPEVPATQEIRVSQETDAAHLASPLKTEPITVCTRCTRQELKKGPNKSTASQCGDTEPDVHTVCTNSQYGTCNTSQDVNLDYDINEGTCTCCQAPITQCYHEPPNYPKSCLKPDRSICGCDSQKIEPPSCYERCRNWEECGCRKPIICTNCCIPKNECSCRLPVNCTNCCQPKENYRKSMFCLYCDNPSENCVCRAPVRKCSCCQLSMDLCRCQDQEIFCDGRPVLTEPDNDRTMYVTAWKPRKEVRRYFSRNLGDLKADTECHCHEKVKSHGSRDLPYQRLIVFSDVMNELQQKISESVCCTRCRKIPCCCTVKMDRDEEREERKMRRCVSPKQRRKTVCPGIEKSRSKSPSNFKCDAGQSANDRPRTVIISLCCACKTSPCRCKAKSSQKKPRAKCYYCKSSPCVCGTARERNKPRPCRCGDSPRRTKEKEIVPCGKVSANQKNNDEKVICVR